MLVLLCFLQKHPEKCCPECLVLDGTGTQLSAPTHFCLACVEALFGDMQKLNIQAGTKKRFRLEKYYLLQLKGKKILHGRKKSGRRRG